MGNNDTQNHKIGRVINERRNPATLKIPKEEPSPSNDDQGSTSETPPESDNKK